MNVAPGQTWTWRDPGGKWRRMFIQYINMSLGAQRAHGINPQSGRRLQCPVTTLSRGMFEARMESALDGYVFEKRY